MTTSPKGFSGLTLWAGLLTILLSQPGAAAAIEEQSDVEPTGSIAVGSDLALRQERQSACVQGDRCKYRITVTNKGPETYSGTINVLRTASFRPDTIKHASEQDVTCTQKLSAVTCRAKGVELSAGQSVAFTLSLAVPPTAAGRVRHCALVAFPGAEFEDPHRDLVAIIQLALKLRGHYRKGDVDGEMSDDLQDAIQALRKEEGLGEGEIDGELITGLFGPAGLMHDDPNAENDQTCDTFELPDNSQALARARALRRLQAARARQERQTPQASTYALRKRGRGWRNIRLDGF